MTSSPHGLYVQGYTRATMDGTEGSDIARWSQSQKAVPSSDWSLQLDSMKLESLVIADQHAAVNTFPGLVHTARHTMRVDCTGSYRANPSGSPKTGAAWLSSARVVRCWVKSRNERNPCL